MTFDLHNQIYVFFFFTILSLLGMVGHYVKKWARREIEGSLFDYFFKDHQRETLLAIGAVVSTAFTVVMTGQLDGMTINQLTMAALTTGWVGDSALNRGSTPPK